MGFNPLKILKGALEVGAEVFGLDSVSAILGKLDSGDLTPEERAAIMDQEVRLRELALEELETELSAKVDLMKAELAQEDKYVKRARPTGLYIGYVVVLGITGAMVAGVQIDSGAILTLVGPILSYGGWYAYNRTQEKKLGRS